MKKVLLIVLACTLMLIACSCNSTQNSNNQGYSTEKTKITLTKENIREYLTFAIEIIDYEINVDYSYYAGMKFPDYSDSYGKAELIINKKSADLSFEDVKVHLKLSVSADNPYPWEFKNGNSLEKHEKYESYNNCTHITCTVPYTGEYSKGIDLVIGTNEKSESILDTSSLSYISVEVISVSGYAIGG